MLCYISASTCEHLFHSSHPSVSSIPRSIRQFAARYVHNYLFTYANCLTFALYRWNARNYVSDQAQRAGSGNVLDAPQVSAGVELPPDND